MLHDEKMYPEPETYNPERFLRPEGTLNPDMLSPDAAVFGFGRRICPGRFVALDSTWIAIARVLALFEIKKAVDENEEEITPDGEYIGGFLRYVFSATQCFQRWSRRMTYCRLTTIAQSHEAFPLRYQTSFEGARGDPCRAGAAGRMTCVHQHIAYASSASTQAVLDLATNLEPANLPLCFGLSSS